MATIDTARDAFMQVREFADAHGEKISSEADARLQLIDRILIEVLVLLCHKRRRRFIELQCGQCPRTIARATPSWKRNVVIEFDT